MTKEEIVKQMQFHRVEYEKLRDEWSVFVKEDALQKHLAEQKKLLEKFKARYSIYLDDMKPIDWKEVEKLIFTWDTNEGYCLGYNEIGLGGIGYSPYKEANGFSLMAKDKVEIDFIEELLTHINPSSKRNK